MPFTFTIKKPDDMQKAFSALKKAIEGHGGTLTGDQESGRIVSDGVDGSYNVKADLIEITVNKKPALLPKSAIEKLISDNLNKMSS